jgi:translation initiation factor 4G
VSASTSSSEKVEKEVSEEKVAPATAPVPAQPSIQVTPATPKEVKVKQDEVLPEPKEQRDEGKDGKRKNRRQQLKEIDKNKKEGSDMDAFLTDEPAVPPPSDKPPANHSEEKKESPPVATETVTDAKPPPAPPAEQTQPPLKTPAPVSDNTEAKVTELAEDKEVEKEAEVTEEVAEDKKVAAENEKNKEKQMKPEVAEESKDEAEPVIKKDPKSKLRYNYPEDQWSPINLEGKKQYDRDFLLQLQFSTESLEKPDGLPKLPDVILDKPLSRHQESRSNMGSIRTNNDFTPGFFKTMQSGGGGKSGSMGRRSQQKDKGGQPRKVISVTLQHDIKLHHTENAWKPSVTAGKPGPADPSKSRTEEILKKVRSILNKLTPQKFKTLVEQILALDINTEERLKGTIDLVFEKAIDEPGFSVAYAQLCKQLSNVKVPTDGEGKNASFRNLLLNRCQVEFENYNQEEDLVKDKELALEKADDEAEKKRLKEEIDEVLSKAKRRSLGNIRFIGELFKLQMLTEPIMHQCVLKLLKSADEDSYECLCRLLSTIGKELDHEKAKNRIDQYFVQIDKIIKLKRTSSRVRFMLQDVYDLRKNRWVPRRADNNPKTIDQIHKEVQMEDQMRAQFLANMPPAPRGGGGGNRRGGGRQGTPGGQMGEDGWQMTKSSYKSNNIDPQKMRLSKQTLDENSIQLGPGGRPGFNSWGRGSSGGGKTSSQEGERPATPGNRFHALTQSNQADSSRTTGRGLTPSRDPKQGGRQTTPRPPKMVSRASQEQDRESALSAVRSLVGGTAPGQRTPTGSRNQSRDSSRSRDVDRDAEAMPPPSVPPPSSGQTAKGLTDQEMEKKTIAVMDEYLHINDLKEAILCIKELESPRNMHLFVYHAINHVLERSPQARKQTGNLLHDVVKQNILSCQTYVRGLLEVLEFAEDMEVDIPKIWSYLGELIGPMVQDGCVPLSILIEVAQPLKACNKAGKLVAEVLHSAACNHGSLKVSDLWRKSQLQWSDFMAPAEINDFVKKNKLEFTMGGEEARGPEKKTLGTEEVMTRLEDLIVRRNESNEVVFDWIEGNVGEPQSKEAPFIRALMTVVCQSAITDQENGEVKLVEGKIPERSILLQKYLDHKGELELQALYALQSLVHKLDHPKGLLRSFFDILYDEDIISEDAFYQWDGSDDSAESAGKGVAKQSVLQFFIWLREADDESQEES